MVTLIEKQACDLAKEILRLLPHPLYYHKIVGSHGSVQPITFAIECCLNTRASIPVYFILSESVVAYRSLIAEYHTV